MAQLSIEAASYHETFKRQMNAAVASCLENIKKAHEKEKAALQSQITLLEAKVERLEAKAKVSEDVQSGKASFEDEIGNLMPLVLIGAAIRRRFLEKAAKPASTWDDLYNHEIKEEFIAEGNDAAHQPNVEADAALWKFELKNGGDRSRLSHMLRAIYGVRTFTCHSGTAHILRTKCQAELEGYNLRAKLHTIAARADVLLSRDGVGLRADAMELLERLKGFDSFMNNRATATEDSWEDWEEAFSNLDDDIPVRERLQEMRILIDRISRSSGRRTGA